MVRQSRNDLFLPCSLVNAQVRAYLVYYQILVNKTYEAPSACMVSAHSSKEAKVLVRSMHPKCHIVTVADAASLEKRAMDHCNATIKAER